MKVNGERIVAKAKRAQLQSAIVSGPVPTTVIPFVSAYRPLASNEAETEYSDIPARATTRGVCTSEPPDTLGTLPPFSREAVPPPVPRLHYLFLEVPFEKYMREYAHRVVPPEVHTHCAAESLRITQPDSGEELRAPSFKYA